MLDNKETTKEGFDKTLATNTGDSSDEINLCFSFKFPAHEFATTCNDEESRPKTDYCFLWRYNFPCRIITHRYAH